MYIHIYIYIQFLDYLFPFYPQDHPPDGLSAWLLKLGTEWRPALRHRIILRGPIDMFQDG